MTPAMKTMIVPVKDLERATALYAGLLGREPSAAESYYVAFETDGLHLGLDPHGADRGLTGPVAFWHVDDLDARLAALLDAGAVVHQPVREVGGGRRVASVTDPDGNVIGLLQDP